MKHKHSSGRLSISKVQTFEQCPFKYKLTYIDLIPTEKTEPLQKGEDLHKIFEEVIKKKPTTLLELRKLLDTHRLSGKYKDQIENFYEFNEKISQEGKVKIPEFVELELFDKEENIIGIVDRVDKTKQNLIILDYKTGKEHPIGDHYFQLGVYVYLFEKLHKSVATHWGIFYSATGKLMIEKVDRKVVKESIEKLRRMGVEIKTSKDYPKCPSALCGWCPFYQKHCEGFGEKYTGEKFWED